MWGATSSIIDSAPLLKLFSSLAVFSSTVPLVSVVIESNGQEYTATLASAALSTVPGVNQSGHQCLGHLDFRTHTLGFRTPLSLTFNLSLEDHPIHDTGSQHTRALYSDLQCVYITLVFGHSNTQKGVYETKAILTRILATLMLSTLKLRGSSGRIETEI